MLKLQARNFDFYEISAILLSHGLESTITMSTIIIHSNDIPEGVMGDLFEKAEIISIQNYDDDNDVNDDTKSEMSQPLISKKNSNSEIVHNDEFQEELVITMENETINSEYHMNNEEEVFLQQFEFEDVSYSKKQIQESEMVYRGEVYKWGLFKNEDREGLIKECVIIIQNDYQNSASDDTIVLFCTSDWEKCAPIQFSFALTESTMKDHSQNRLGFFDRCTMFVGHIKGINRNQLGEYLGTMTDMFMNTLQPTIDYCLGLKRTRTVNWAQLQILSTINMAELFEISNAKISKSEKVTQFLKLFKFDMDNDSIEYVKKAILVANTLKDYRLEDLAVRIAKKEDIESEEVLRIIVARIKENFKLKRSSAISFIRLIDRFLRKGREF